MECAGLYTGADRAYGNNKMFILLIKVGGGAEFMCQPQDLGLHKGRKCQKGEKHWKSENVRRCQKTSEGCLEQIKGVKTSEECREQVKRVKTSEDIRKHWKDVGRGRVRSQVKIQYVTKKV